MSIKKSIFGHSETERAWKEFCHRSGARFVEAPLFGFGDGKIQLETKCNIITLDTLRHHTVASHRGTRRSTRRSPFNKMHPRRATRIRAPFLNPTKLRFRVSRVSFWTRLIRGVVWPVEVLAAMTERLPFVGSLFGGLRSNLERLHIRTGHPKFDEEFHVIGTDVARTRSVLADGKTIELMREIPNFVLDIRGAITGVSLTKGLSILYLQQSEIARDHETLNRLFQLFARLGENLIRTQIFETSQTERILRDLGLPAAQLWDGNAVLWDTNLIRRRAAVQAGESRCEDSIPLLLKIVRGERKKSLPISVPALRNFPVLSLGEEDDEELRCKAIWALGEIAHTQCIPDLIPFLGKGELYRKGCASSVASEALGKLGMGEFVEAFFKLLERDVSGISLLREEHRSQVIAALTGILTSDDDLQIANAAWALARLRAIEALPQLRSLRVRIVAATSEVREQWRRAIEELEALASLPRPTQSTVTQSADLPRAVGAETPSTETLPRGTREHNII